MRKDSFTLQAHPEMGHALSTNLLLTGQPPLSPSLCGHTHSHMQIELVFAFKFQQNVGSRRGWGETPEHTRGFCMFSLPQISQKVMYEVS